MLFDYLLISFDEVDLSFGLPSAQHSTLFKSLWAAGASPSRWLLGRPFQHPGGLQLGGAVLDLSPFPFGLCLFEAH